jgi:hypothetical protein
MAQVSQGTRHQQDIRRFSSHVPEQADGLLTQTRHCRG